jgi:protein gp37
MARWVEILTPFHTRPDRLTGKIMNKTKIQWTDYTWNPITGCTPVSPGCANCYAAAMAKRFNGGDFKPKVHPDRLSELEKLKTPSKIFVCSMGDFFHEKVKLIWRCMVLEQILKNPQHKYLFLTKRPEVIPWGEELYEGKNIWLGTTIENQERAFWRISSLFGSTQPNLFLSVEPMLERIDLGAFLAVGKIRWVICGPETGAGARPFEYAWAADLYGQCLKYNVPFFFKGNDLVKYHYRELPMEWPEGLK